MQWDLYEELSLGPDARSQLHVRLYHRALRNGDQCYLLCRRDRLLWHEVYQHYQRLYQLWSVRACLCCRADLLQRRVREYWDQRGKLRHMRDSLC